MAANINALLNSVPKLGVATSDGNTTSYQDWKFAMSMVLRRAGCWELMAKEKPTTRDSQTQWESKAEEALTAIGLTIDPSQYQYISDAADGVDAWKKLQKVHEKNSRANRIALMRKFYNAHHEAGKPILDYVNGVINTSGKLKSLGVKIEDSTVIDVLIMNLDETWSSLATSLSTTTDDNTVVSDVTGALIDEDTRRSANNELGDQRFPDQAMVGKYSPNVTCYNCGKKGHFARNCREVKKNEKGKDDVKKNDAPDDAHIAIDLDYAF